MSVSAIRKVAVHALLQVAAGAETPAAARGAAARSLLELVGDLGPRSTPLREREARDLTELSPEELAAELRELEGFLPDEKTKPNNSKKLAAKPSGRS